MTGAVHVELAGVDLGPRRAQQRARRAHLRLGAREQRARDPRDVPALVRGAVRLVRAVEEAIVVVFSAGRGGERDAGVQRGEDVPPEDVDERRARAAAQVRAARRRAPGGSSPTAAGRP